MTLAKNSRSSMQRLLRVLRWTLVFVWLVIMARHTTKPLPPGTDVASPVIALSEQQLEFLYDLTTRDAWGRPLVEQQIFNAALATIDNAATFVVLDFFLFNDDMGASTGSANASLRPLSRELADHLLARKRALPALQVLLITDPINDVYGGRPSPLLAELSRAGIDVVRTDLSTLRDSNPAYSALWRMTTQWFGNAPGSALPDPFRNQGAVSVRSWLALLNFKANHRKVIVADNAQGEWTGMIMSANPHDASSLHSNVAWRFRGELAARALDSELKVARFSDWSGNLVSAYSPSAAKQDEALAASYVSEQAIRETLLAALKKTQAGDEISMAMFYLADRHVIDTLLAAAQRGVTVRLILDPNKDAFGIEKDGVPNRPVANELVTKSQNKIAVRWYRTQGEQFHTKLVLIKQGTQLSASLGSANLTRRNIGNYNLEANIQVAMPVDSALAKKLSDYFTLLWNNDEQKHIEYTAAFAAYKDESKLRYWRYRFMEATGIGTF
jgi:phosphatidylserine/phosphatidylglycerophosphate/cardiolipin synthase-like enzyme